MNKFVKSASIAVFTAMLTTGVSASATGSCQEKAAKLSLGATVSGRLVEEYDSDWGETTGYPVYYFKLTVKKGDTATIVMNGESPYIADVYEDDIYEGESESAPPWWEDASNPYASETRFILRAEEWDEDSPKSVTYYIVIGGEEIGEGFSLQTAFGEQDPTLPRGVDADTAVSISPNASIAPSKGALTEAHGSGYYFKAILAAGSKYYFGTYDTTTNRTDVRISGLEDSSIVPEMTPVEDMVDGVQIADELHAGYCVIPSKTAVYTIFVSNDSLDVSTSVTLWHKAIPSRAPTAHTLAAALGTPGSTALSASISPAYRNNPESGFFDNTIDDALVSVKLAKGSRYLFNVDSLSSDTANLVMELYDAKGNMLLASGKSFFGEGIAGPMFVCEVSSDGIYYVGVCQGTADSKGDENPVGGLTGRISVSTVTTADDAFLDEYDDRTDPNAEVTSVTPVIGEYGDSPETVDVAGQEHNFGLTDWVDTFSIPVRKGITYSFSVTPETRTIANGPEELTVSGSGFAYAGTLYSLSGKTKTPILSIPDMSSTPLSFMARANATYYLEITKDGQGVPAAYTLHTMASAPEGIGYLTVNIHGPSKEAGAGWYLKGDSISINYASGSTVLLAASDAVTVKFLSVTGWSTAADVVGAVKKGETAVFDAYYNDMSDPLDDNPDKSIKEPTLKKPYAPTILVPNAKGVAASRSLWRVDSADWFTFTATAGTFYKFSLSDIEGDPEVRVYGPDNWTGECEYVLSTNVAESIQICAGKGVYYVKISHADMDAPSDSAYTLTTESAIPGVVKLAKTNLTVKDSDGHVDLQVSRTGKDGVMRVKYRTEGVQTGSTDAYYYPTNGVLVWAQNDNKVQTIRVKLVPNAGWDTNKVFKVVLEPFATEDETFDASVEYPATFATDAKSKLPLDTATITVAASAKKSPGTIQTGTDTPKKPVYTVTSGETASIPFVRVSGADGIVGVKVETVKGSANKAGETDFSPVLTNLVWKAGETATQTVAIATKTVAGDYTAVKTFTLKLTALSSKKDDAVQYDRPTLASTTVTLNIVNEKFANTMAAYAKTVTAAKDGYTVKEAKAGQWVVNADGSFFAPAKGDLTFTFSTTGMFSYIVNGEAKTFTATAKDKTLSVKGATTFKISGYAPDGEPVALRQGVKYKASFGNEGTVKATKLPDGLKLAQDKATKEWVLAGTPSKAGIYQVAYTTTIDRNTPATISNVFYTVAAEGTAAGTFNGLATSYYTTNGVPSLASVTITAALGGKLSASVSIAGKKYSFVDTGYSSVTCDWSNPDTPVTNMTAELSLVQKIGSGNTAQTVTNWLYYTIMDVPETDPSGWLAEGTVDIHMAALPDVKGSGYQEDVSYSGKVYRDNSKSGKDGKAAWESAMAAHAGYYTVSLTAPYAILGEPCGNGYMTMTLDAKGKARLAGKLADGTAYSGSATASLIEGAAAPFVRVPLYAQKSSWVFGGWLSIKTGDNGIPVTTIDLPDSDLAWKNDASSSTRDGEEGFALDIVPVGGWYDTVSNLQRFYLESDFSVDLPEGDNALDDIMDALNLGDDYSFAAQPSGQAIDLVGNSLLVAKQILSKDVSRKSYDWATSANASNVKLAFKRATGIVSGTFDLWYEGTNAKGVFEQKSISGLKHEGVLILSCDDDGYFEDDVLSSGFFLAPQTLSKTVESTVGGRTSVKTVTRKWNGSYRFDIKAKPVERIWTDKE